MLLSAALYALIIYQIPSQASFTPAIFHPVVFIVLGFVVGLFYSRQKLIKPCETILANNPDDQAALKKWRTGYLLSYAFSEAIVLCGVVLHFFDFPMREIAPFLIAGFLLIAIFPPRMPATARE